MENLLAVKDVAARLGLKEATVRLWLAKRRLAYVRLGKRAVRVPATEVQRLIESGTVPAREASRGRGRDN